MEQSKLMFNIGDIVYSPSAGYGLVSNWDKERNIMHVIFFDQPNKAYEYYMDFFMLKCWEKVE